MWNDAIKVPADLKVMIGRNRIILISGDRQVPIDNNPDSGPFSSGPMLLTEYYERFLLPALARLDLCLVPYAELPPAQRLRDALFRAVVLALR